MGSRILAVFLQTTLITAVFSSLSLSKANAQRPDCYEVQDPDGWVYVRDSKTREVLAQLPNAITFQSYETLPGNRVVIGGFSNRRLVVSRSRLRRVDYESCMFKYRTVRDSDGYANIRSTPNGSVIDRVNHGTSVLSLGQQSRDGDWLKVMTSQGTIGWIANSRLVPMYD
jgi:Bacterial SH3 domain